MKRDPGVHETSLELYLLAIGLTVILQYGIFYMPNVVNFHT